MREHGQLLFSMDVYVYRMHRKQQEHCWHEVERCNKLSNGRVETKVCVLSVSYFPLWCLKQIFILGGRHFPEPTQMLPTSKSLAFWINTAVTLTCILCFFPSHTKTLTHLGNAPLSLLVCLPLSSATLGELCLAATGQPDDVV